MPNDKASDRIAAYVGISAPETPKYLLTNNFLLDYFELIDKEAKTYNFQLFEDSGVLHAEDETNKDKLKKAFDEFLNRYLGEETIKGENRRLSINKHFYFPLTLEMLTKSNPTLRHMLYHLQDLDEKFDYKDMSEKLANYIFNDNSGINHILKILFQNQDKEILFKDKPDKSDVFWNMLTSRERSNMKKLGERLNQDLNTLMTHKYFCMLDFYRRYNYLSILLTSYVIQYIVVRKGDNVCMLCKGSHEDNRLNGTIHRACCSNYASIRDLFPELLQSYYKETIRKEADEKGKLKLLIQSGKVWVNDKLLVDFVMDVMGSRSRKEIEYEKLVKAFSLIENEENLVPADEFVLRYIELTGTKAGSMLTKISSTLPTSGKQIDMVYPNSNARQKYFAMSKSLTEFYVRLYLASKDQQYDYLDNFLEHLESRYRIVIAKSKDNEKRLSSMKIKISTSEFTKNKIAFIDTLNNINCLIKLSDSGYVVTLPEEKGDFKLI